MSTTHIKSIVGVWTKTSNETSVHNYPEKISSQKTDYSMLLTNLNPSSIFGMLALTNSKENQKF